MNYDGQMDIFDFIEKPIAPVPKRKSSMAAECIFSGHTCNKEDIWLIAESLDDILCKKVCCRKCDVKLCGARCNGSKEPNNSDMRPCVCGSENIEIRRTEQGIHSGLYIYHCQCEDCGTYGTEDGCLHWVSTAESEEQAIREWNTNPRRIHYDGRKTKLEGMR